MSTASETFVSAADQTLTVTVANLTGPATWVPRPIIKPANLARALALRAMRG